MALNIDFGGDNEYAGAAAKAAGDSKLGIFGIIKSVLDSTGIHRQVVKGPKTADLADNETPKGKADAQTEAVAAANQNSDTPVTINSLAQTETALGVQPLPMTQAVKPLSPWGETTFNSIRPLTQIDPDLGILQGNFDNAFKR